MFPEATDHKVGLTSYFLFFNKILTEICCNLMFMANWIKK